MSAPIFFAENLGSVTFGATSTNSSYPLINLNSYDLQNLGWQSNATTSPQYLTMDLGVAMPIGGAVLYGVLITGLAGSGACHLQYDTGDNPAFPNPQGVATPVTNAGAQFFTFGSVTKRYWRLAFTGSPITADPQCAQVILCPAFQPSFPYDFGYPQPLPMYVTTEKTNLAGSLIASQSYGGRNILKWAFTHNLNSTDLSGFTTLFETTKMKLRPFWVLDIDGATLYYVKFDGDYVAMTVDNSLLNNIKTLQMKEVYANY